MHATANRAKMEQLTGFILRPGQWDADAAAWSRRIPHDWPGDHVENLRRQHSAGEIELVHVYEDGRKAGFLAYARDGREFVIVSCFSRTGDDFCAQALPQIEALALAAGCDSIRFHTMRPGLVKKAQTLGFRVSEIILRKAL